MHLHVDDKCRLLNNIVEQQKKKWRDGFMKSENKIFGCARFRISYALIVIVLIISCTKEEDLLKGTWKAMTDENTIIEFYDDHTGKVSTSGTSKSFTWNIVNSDLLKAEGTEIGTKYVLFTSKFSKKDVAKEKWLGIKFNDSKDMWGFKKTQN